MKLQIKYLDDAEDVVRFVEDENIEKGNIVAINTSNDTEGDSYVNKVVLYYYA